MLDIETLGPGPGSIITSITLVPFNLNGKPLQAGDINPHNEQLSVGEQLAKGYELNPETLVWWMEKPEQIRQAMMSGDIVLYDAMDSLEAYMLKVKDLYGTYRIWATSAKLDFGCISYTWAKELQPYPFDHRAEHCARTVRNLTKMLVPSYKLDADKGRNHDSLTDCRVQISQIQEQYQALRKLGAKDEQLSKLAATLSE